ncbi:MAG: peptide ligase PGM1-related protein [Vicinamibacterales bacterium]
MPQPPDLRSPDDIQAAFDALQPRLTELWRSIERFTPDAQTIVVVPSISVDTPMEGTLLQAYEERFLFLLLLLRQPRARLVYVTSQAIHPEVVDYYLGLLPGVIASHARARLFLVTPLDGSSETLTAKLLARPRLIQEIRGLIPDPRHAHLVPYSTTPLERELAVRLGIPMYGADAKFHHFGTKTGGRRLFAEEDVRHPLGESGLSSLDDVARAIVAIRARRPALASAVVKLNEGVSGEGNAMVSLDGLPPPGDSAETAAVMARVRAMRFESPDVTFDEYAAKLAERGAVVEERIAGREFRSPSAQLRITPLGRVEMLSTHDQVLGGPQGQSYLGCRFPADQGYAADIMREAAKVGARLAREGVIGRFAIDFVSVRRDDGAWESYAIEINLRKGGTTHPFLTLQFLTNGAYDAEAGVFRTRRGVEKCFVASDHLESPGYRVFTHRDLFDLAARHDLHFDQARQTGVVFHMMNALGELGRVGLTAVGNTHEEAEALYGRTVSALDAEADAARRDPR